MNILVTGGTRGLGLEIVRQQLAAGHDLFVVARQPSQELEALRQLYPQRLVFIACDLSQPATIKATIFDAEMGKQLPLHALVNNAAIAYDDIVSNVDLDKLDELYRVNVFSPIQLTRCAIRQMLLHRVQGSIVHISSVSAHTGYKGLAMYASTKGAIEAFSKNVAREWGAMGIRSNCVVPGFMETDMSASLSEEQKQRIFKRTSLQRSTEVKSAAATVGFLLSDAASSITGQEFFVDAGTI